MVPVPTQTGPQCPRAAGGWSRAKAAEWGSLKVRSLRDRFKVAGSGRVWGHQPCPLFWTQREASPGPGSAPSPGDLPTARCPWPGRTWLTSSGATPSSLPGRGPSPAAWPPRTRPACGRLPGPVPQDSPPPDRGALWPPSCSSLWDQGGLVACRQVGDKSPPDPGSPGSRRLRSRSDPPRHPAPPRPPAPRRQWNARGRDPRSAPPPPFPAVPGRPGGVSIQGSQGQGAGGRDRQRAGDARGKRAASPVRTPGPPASGSSSSARAASPGMAWPCARPSVRVPPCVRPVEPGRPPPLARDRGGGGGGQWVTSRRPARRCPNERARRQALRARGALPGAERLRRAAPLPPHGPGARGWREAGPRAASHLGCAGERRGRQNSGCGAEVAGSFRGLGALGEASRPTCPGRGLPSWRLHPRGEPGPQLRSHWLVLGRSPWQPPPAQQPEGRGQRALRRPPSSSPRGSGRNTSSRLFPAAPAPPRWPDRRARLRETRTATARPGGAGAPESAAVPAGGVLPPAHGPTPSPRGQGVDAQPPRASRVPPVAGNRPSVREPCSSPGSPRLSLHREQRPPPGRQEPRALHGPGLSGAVSAPPPP